MSRTRDKQIQAKRDARTQRRRNQTRDEILEVASQIVLRDGFTNFTIAAVAEELGLTKPALYYYFDSKEAVLFELLLQDWIETGVDVEEAVEETRTGADAVEAIIRTVFARYIERLDMFMLVHQKMVEMNGSSSVKPDVERFRPVNDMLYAGAEARLIADQAAGVFPADRNPRLFAFTAHTAVIGLLNMRAITASADDPLIHSDEDLLDDLCTTFRQAATQGATS